MVAPVRKLHGREHEGRKPRPPLPKIIQCAACGYDLPSDQHPRNDRLALLDVCPKCHGFAWELLPPRANPTDVKPMPYEPRLRGVR